LSGGRRPLVGVLGGMGPAATVDLYAKVVALAGAARDQDHVRLLIDGDPEVPDRQASVAGTGESAAPALVAKALRLKAAGAEVLAMACHSAHAYQRDVEEATGLPFLSLVETAVRAAAAAAPGASTAGLLATPAVLEGRVYEGPAAAAGLRLVTPDDVRDGRKRLMDLVWRVKAGDVGAGVRAAMAGLAAELVGAGAGVVIAACTEVPLVLGQEDVTVPLVDPTAALAAALVALGTPSGG
jgi:aspartate racemase